MSSRPISSSVQRLSSFGPANLIARSAETHPLTWRLRDDGAAVWLTEYQSKDGYTAARSWICTAARSRFSRTGPAGTGPSSEPLRAQPAELPITPSSSVTKADRK